MAATLIKDPLLTESNTGDLLGTEGVMLDNGTLHFQPPFSTACSALSGQQSQGSPPKMLPPVHFNILGKIQRRKPSSPSGLLPSSPRHVTGQTQSKSQKRSLLQSTNDSDSATRKTLRTERSSSADSPLDFSKKAKLEDVEEDDDDPASPSSRLRNILSMKCHIDPDSLPERVLNLSKEMESSPPSPTWLMGKLHPAGSAESSSCSPTLLDQRNSGLSSPSADIMKSGSSTTSPCRISPPNNTTSGNPVNLAPYSLFTPVALNHMRPQLPLQLPMMDGNNGLALHPGLGVNPVQLPTNLPLAPSDSSSKGRITRPFKAYPKDPMSFSTVGLYGLPLGTMPGSTEALIHQQSNAAYAEFRKQMLSQSNVHRSRRGNQRNVISHSNDPLASPLTFSMDNGSNGDSGSGKSGGKTEQQMKDEAYWERRRKNNEAAKRSRDARRAKEDEIAIRAAFLEQENLKLRFELCALKNETAKLRCMLYSS